MKKLVLSVALLAVSAGAAQAHTAFMKPTSFYPTDERTTVEAAYAQQFFTPAIGINSPNFTVIAPDGQTSAFGNMAVSAQDSTLEAALPDRGTYRLTTGELVGGVTRLVGDGAGGWRPLAAGETPPEGEQTTTIQTVTVADTYVTQGAVNRTAVDAPSGHLTIHPITHPNQVLATAGFEVELLLDGHPFPNFPFVLYDSGDPETKVDRTFVTNEQGRATLTFDHPGTYVVAVRYRSTEPAGSEVEHKSFTTTLTFEALTSIPQPTPERRDRNNRRQRDHSRLF